MTRAPYLREAVFWALIVAVGLSYFGTNGSKPFTSGQPQGYYGALTNAFLSGQVSLLERPDPRLVRTPNPYVPLLDVPRPHDMSLFQGRLYLYFGAAPVVLLYLPWRLLTGRWLADPAGTTWFCFVGVVAAGCLLRRVRNRYFPGCRDAWVWLGLSVLAWGSPVYYLSQNGTFYAVPISCAFCCAMLAAAATERALAAEGARVRNAWLAVASLAFGLAVGSRPNYVFGLATLLIPAAYLSRRRDLGPLIAACVPAGLVGVAMGVYNFERFHDPFEFGMRFALMPADYRAFPIMGLAYLPANVRGYLFRGATYVRYFPFFLNDGTYGLLRYLPFCVLGVLAGGTGARLRSGYGVLVAMVAGIAACNLLSLGLFFYFGEQRYMTDIAPAALLFGGLGCLATMGSPRGLGRQVAMGGAVIALGLFSIANGSLAALQTFTGVVPSAVKRLDSISLWAERMAGAGYGPLEFNVRFPPNRVGHREPLLATGLPGRADMIFVEYLATDRARFGFFHSGSGGPIGQPVQIGPGPHRLTIGMGSLYPPVDSPLFRELTPGYAVDLKKLLRVSIDGRPVLAGNEGFYFATPGLTFTGANQVATDVSDPAFTGQISPGRRLGLPSAKEVAPGLGFAGPIRLQVRFANDRVGPSEPLVTTGSHGDGACLFVTYLGPNRIRFGLENRGSVVTSDPVETDLARPHVVDVELGSLYPPGHGFSSPAEAETLRSRLSVRLDGKLVLVERRAFSQPTR